MLTIQEAKPTTPLCTIEHVTLNSNSWLTRRNCMLHTPVCLDIGFMLQMINAARIPADVLLNGEVVLVNHVVARSQAHYNPCTSTQSSMIPRNYARKPCGLSGPLILGSFGQLWTILAEYLQCQKRIWLTCQNWRRLSSSPARQRCRQLPRLGWPPRTGGTLQRWNYNILTLL